VSSRAEADAAVVGSGLAALVVALELRRRGGSVAVIDPGRGNAPRGLGLVALGFGQPYSVTVRRLGRPAAQLLWAAGAENHLRLRALLDEAGRDCGYRPHGSFLLAEARDEARDLAESEDLLQEDGFQGEFLDHYMLETRFDVPGFAGAYWAAADADLDPARLHALVAGAARAAGVSFATGPLRALQSDTAGVVIETDAGTLRAGALVVATDGPVTPLLPELAPLLRPVSLRLLRATAVAGSLLPFAARAAGGRVAWQEREGRLEVVEAGADSDAARRVAGRLPIAPGSLDEIAPATEEAWDGLPVVGRLPGRPVALVAGLLPSPASLAFAAARWVSDALRTGSDPTPAPLQATRAAAPGPV